MSEPQFSIELAPLVESDLTSSDSVVIRQESQYDEMVLQSMGVPCERQNRYKIARVPDGVTYEMGKWKPSDDELKKLPHFIRVRERSSVGSRVCLGILGCLNFRPLKLKFYSDREERQNTMSITRPFKLTGQCCSPLTMIVQNAQGEVIGRCIEDFKPYCGKWFQLACMCTVYKKLQLATGRLANVEVEPVHPEDRNRHEELLDIDSVVFKDKYILKANIGCCGTINNCCAATCCRHSAYFDVLSADTYEPVARVQKTYAGIFRMFGKFSNYVIQFEPGSSQEARAVLLTSVFDLDYHLFESQGGSE